MKPVRLPLNTDADRVAAGLVAWPMADHTAHMLVASTGTLLLLVDPRFAGHSTCVVEQHDAMRPKITCLNSGGET